MIIARLGEATSQGDQLKDGKAARWETRE